MESESDVGGSDDEDYGKAFDMAEDDEDDEGDDVKEEEEEAQPSDGEYVVPNRPRRKVCTATVSTTRGWFPNRNTSSGRVAGWDGMGWDVVDGAHMHLC